MELNLAPFKYRNIFSKDGGPINRLSVAFWERPSRPPEFEAVAFLSPELVPQWYKNSAIYSEGHGSGTHKIRNIACYIAMSEAMERWAYFVASDSPQHRLFGFDIEPNTNGMAAFPGLIKTPARKRANWEAVERWSIVEWWHDKLPAILSPGSSRNSGAIYISQPFNGCHTVITWSQIASGGTVYGFAAADTPETALNKASIEQARNIIVLEQFYKGSRCLSEDFIADEKNFIYDRRLIFFASSHGSDIFWKKAMSSSKLHTIPEPPAKLIDCEINGLWSRYAIVWRILYKQTSYEHLDKSRHDIFLF